MPTATTYTADLAPADMRGRYMSIYSLTWGVAQGIAPLAGEARGKNGDWGIRRFGKRLSSAHAAVTSF